MNIEELNGRVMRLEELVAALGGGGGGGGSVELTGDVTGGPSASPIATAFALAVKHAWTASQYGVPQTITDASTTTAVDARTANNFYLLCTSAVGATRAIPNPTNLSAGMILNFYITQPSSGGPCAVTWGAKFKWGVGGTGAAPSGSTAANAVDFYSGTVAPDGNIYTVQLGQAGAAGLTGPAGSPGPAFKVALTTGQSFSAATFTKCNFDTALYDTASCWDAANFRYTPNVAGKYRFVLHLTADPGPTDWGICDVRFNGSQVQISPIWYAAVSGQARMSTVIDFDMNGTTDYVEGFGYSNTGSPVFRASGGGAFYNSFSGSFLHT